MSARCSQLAEVLGIVALGCIAACAKPTPQIAPVPVIRYLFPTGGAAAVGDSVPLEAIVCAGDQCIADPSLTAESSDPAVAHITSTGFVHALAPGQATITLTSTGVAPVTLPLRVVPPLRKLILQPDSITVAVGDTVRLTASGVDSSGVVTTVVPALFWFNRTNLVPLEEPSGTLVARAAREGRFVVSVRMFQREATAVVRVRRKK